MREKAGNPIGPPNSNIAKFQHAAQISTSIAIELVSLSNTRSSYVDILFPKFIFADLLLMIETLSVVLYLKLLDQIRTNHNSEQLALSNASTFC